VDAAAGFRYSGGVAVIHPNHFETTDGALSPQPWMQLRLVASGEAEAAARSYGTTGGAAKNDLLQTVTQTWTNNTPLTQQVYGLVTQGGSAVTLQTRSRGYLRMDHGFALSGNPVMTEVSRFGGGAEIGMGGLLSLGTGFGVHEVRQPSTTIPLMPQLTGWITVIPGASITAKVDVRFVSEFWESTPIDGGDSNTDSSVIAGALRLDLFAVPQITEPGPRPVPQIVGTPTTATAINTAVTVTKPTGVVAGDVLVAICGNNAGTSNAITAPAGWALLHSVNDGLAGLGGSHLRVFTKVAGASEPANYTFGNSTLIEEVVCLVALRNAGSVGGDVNSLGWAVASTRRRWAKDGELHIAPSVARNGQLLLCASFFARTDNPLDLTLGPAAVAQTPPDGMTEIAERNGTSVSLAVASLNSPPNPTWERLFATAPRAYFASWSISVSIVIPGAQQL
jgi:hypothetical protein